MPVRTFATKKDKDADANVEASEAPVKKRRGRPPKAAKLEAEEVSASADKPAAKKTTRASRAKKVEFEEGAAADSIEAIKPPVKRTRKSKASANKPVNMYVLKFNSPILPYAKFPLTHNRYI